MLSPAEMHYLGLKIIHQIDELPSDFRSTGNGIKYRCFRSFYGVDPETCCDVLADIETLAPVGLRLQNADPSKLLMALEWVNTNKKDLELQGLYALKTNETLRKGKKKYVLAIQGLKGTKVRELTLILGSRSTVLVLCCLTHAVNS